MLVTKALEQIWIRNEQTLERYHIGQVIRQSLFAVAKVKLLATINGP